MPAVPPKRLPIRALVAARSAFRDVVHGRSRLQASGRALARRLVQRCAAGGAGGRTTSATDGRATSGGATSTTRFSRSWSRKPSASIPACARRACASSRRAPSSVSPAAASTLNCSSSMPMRCESGRSRADGPDFEFLDRWSRARRRLGAGLLGQVPARHRVGGRRLFREHRPVRRHPGARRGAGRELLHRNSHDRAAAADRARERRAAEAQPRDHRAPVPQRQRIRARRAAGPHALPEHAGDDPRTGGQSAPDPERARRPARAGRPARCRRWRPGASGFPKQTSGSSPTCPPIFCAVGPTCAPPSCRWPRSRPASG